MPALAEFQSEFAAALLDPDAPLCARLGNGFAVYQNTVAKGLIDILRANYPTVEQLVGAEWFDSAALLYARKHLPTEPPLALYGVTFPSFLHSLDVVAELPYLHGVAQLDRLWTEAHFAADGLPLTAGALQELNAAQLANVQLQLHPATRAAWLPHSALTLWQHNRPPATPSEGLEIDDVAQGALITRAMGEVKVMALKQADHVFVLHVIDGLPLGEVAMRTLQQHPDADIAAILSSLIASGAFAAEIAIENNG